jgi:hypothetical protein
LYEYWSVEKDGAMWLPSFGLARARFGARRIWYLFNEQSEMCLVWVRNKIVVCTERL